MSQLSISEFVQKITTKLHALKQDSEKFLKENPDDDADAALCEERALHMGRLDVIKDCLGILEEGNKS